MFLTVGHLPSCWPGAPRYENTTLLQLKTAEIAPSETTLRPVAANIPAYAPVPGLYLPSPSDIGGSEMVFLGNLDDSGSNAYLHPPRMHPPLVAGGHSGPAFGPKAQ